MCPIDVTPVENKPYIFQQETPQQEETESLELWYEDGADNPIANQYYDVTDHSNPKYFFLNYSMDSTQIKYTIFNKGTNQYEEFFESPTKFLVTVKNDDLDSGKFPDNLVLKIKNNAKPVPPLPLAPVIGGNCHIDLNPNIYYDRFDYHTRANIHFYYDSNGTRRSRLQNVTTGIINTGNTCWIASSIQLLNAMHDIYDFFHLHATADLPEPLAIVQSLIRRLNSKNNIDIPNYDDFYKYYKYQGQRPREEGSVSIFLGTFFYYLEKYKAANPTQVKNNVHQQNPSFFNLNFKYLTSFGILNEYYYFFDTTKTARTTDRETVYAKDLIIDQYDINTIFSISLFDTAVAPPYNMTKIQSTKDLILQKLFPSYNLLTGRTAININIPGVTNIFNDGRNNITSVLDLHRIEEHTFIPKYIPIMVAPPFNSDNFDTQMNGMPDYKHTHIKLDSPDDDKYLKHIDICFTIKPSRKNTEMSYFLTGMICFLGSLSNTSHFVAIVIDTIDKSAKTITYILLNDAAPPKNITFPMTEIYFPSSIFYDPTIIPGFNAKLYPYILMYERTSDVDTTSNSGFLE